MGLKEACPNRSDNSCQVSCKDPNVPNQCRILSALLVDGSPCGVYPSLDQSYSTLIGYFMPAGFGGTCAGGKCQPAGALATAKVRCYSPFACMLCKGKGRKRT